jgi:SAM-dependent methyltransferase
LHRSAHAHMALCIERHMEKGRRYRVLDLGSRIARAQKLTHRQLLAGYDVAYTGVDVVAGPNVDVVMRRPYRIPARSRSVDVVLSGQTFEHIAFPWASILEIARVLTPGGLAFIVAPSRGHAHGRSDCWRYYPDGMRALAAWSGLAVIEAHTDFPPAVEGVRRRRDDYARIDTANYYWGDSVGVFRKPPARHRVGSAVACRMMLWRANRIGGLGAAPPPAPSRDDVLGVTP